MATLTDDQRRVPGTHETCVPGFVGREREIATLTRALDEPAVVLVEGEAGIGKSRLVHELLAATADRHRKLVGVCPPFRESLTLSPIVDAVRQDTDRVAGLRLSALAGALRPLFPEWAADLPPAPEPLTDAKAARHRLFRALAELIGCLDITVLVVEDVHWADVVTLEFLLFLASCQQPRGLSLVVTYRPEDVPAESLLLRLSSRLPAGITQVRIPLAPLDVRGTAELVSSMLDGGPVSEALTGFLHQRTDGVPLAVEESVRLLHARADLARRDGEWVRRRRDELRVPPTVRDAVLERVQRLSRPAQRVLQSASVLAEPAGEAVVAEVAKLPGDQVRVGLAEAVACGLLREDHLGRVAFRHFLMGRAVYEAVPGVELRRLHLSAGNALEAVTPRPVVQLTRHFRAAGDSERWGQYAEEAAELVIASGDHGTAAHLLNDVLTAARLPVPTQVRLAHKLAVSAIFRMDAVDDLHRQVVGTLRTLLETARLDPGEEAAIRSPMGRLLGQLGDLEGARAELERAVPYLGHDPVEAARAMSFLGLPFIGHRPASVHLQWLQRAADIEERLLPPADRLALTVDRAGGLLQLGEEDGWSVAARIPATASSVEERRQIARGWLNIGSTAIIWGRYGHARERLAVARKLADADRYLRIRCNIEISQAQLDWFTGNWDGLAERIAAVVDPAGDEPLSHLGAIRMGLLYAALGSLRRAETHLDHALEEARRLGAVDDVLEPAAGLARARLLEDRVTDALRVTDEPVRTIATKGIWIWATDVAPVRVEALIAAERLSEAASLVAMFTRGLRGRDAPAARAALAMCHALLSEGRGDYACAAGLFSRAAGAWELLPRPYDRLRARERRSLCLLKAGDSDAALDLLSGTRQGFSELGAHGDADRVASRLRECGVDARREWRRGRRGYGDQLSPRELEVVRLVVTGRTNREIAHALSRSPKTVAGQLSSAMRKLGVSSRTQLAVGVVEAGITPDPRTLSGR